MCGIAGVIAFTNEGKKNLELIHPATSCLALRGPDAEGFIKDVHIALGHRRLSIIDTSNAGTQPLSDESGRYTIVFNGEFFNYKEHREKLIEDGVHLKSESDTEVLLHLYIQEGEKCIEKVNGFFALCIYDKKEKTVFMARDRMGVKPFLYYQDKDNLFFASEMKSLQAFSVPKNVDHSSLQHYLQFNYIPNPWSIYSDVKKLKAGHFIKFNLMDGSPVAEACYYKITNHQPKVAPPYEHAQQELFTLMRDAVERRLVSDVPLGAFLSGGIDSSVIVGLASQKVKGLHTFSIGYKDEPFFDETHYAQLVANMHGTEHTVFKLSNNELFENLDGILNYIDEPFADSSAIAVYILSKYTRKKVTVALSGDGADEMFGGYQKHRAEWLIRNKPFVNTAVKILSPLLPLKKGSRQSAFQNKIRQLHRYAEGAKLTASERYLRWCGVASEKEAKQLLLQKDDKNLTARKSQLVKNIQLQKGINDVLLTDMDLVLTGDMLTKVDLMSMANSLEIRNPFLDYKVVDFAFSLPSDYKIDGHQQKRIVKDAFRKILPPEIYHRGKKGFEVPLLKWFQTELRSKIENVWLDDKFIREQNVFDANEIYLLKQQLFSDDPGDIQARIWALIVFQNWWLKYHHT